MQRQTHDPLELLLQQADAAAGGPPALPGDLPKILRNRARRTRQLQLGIGTMAASIAVLAGLSCLFFYNNASSPGQCNQSGIAGKTGTAPSETDIAALQAEVVRLNAQIESLTAVVEQMRQLEADDQRINKLRRELARLDISDQIAREVDEAVFIMVYDADQRLKQPGQREEAIKIYRNVIRLFPQSRWAKVARKKLSEIEANKGDLS